MAKPDPQNEPELLTLKQEAFCRLAAVTSYAEAFRQAYNPPDTYNWRNDVWKLTKNPKIIRAIRRYQDEAFGKLDITRDWLLKWWLYRMIYDPAEITNWAVGACRFCYGDGHQYQWRAHEYWSALSKAEQSGDPLPDIGGGFGFDSTLRPVEDCPGCHGRGIGRTDISDTSALSPMARAAFEGIKETKNGIEIKMADKDKAAENFAKLSGFDVQQVRIMADNLPDADVLAAMRNDPLAASAAYKRMLGTTH